MALYNASRYGLARMRNSVGTPNAAMAKILDWRNQPHARYFEDDFLGDTINLDMYALGADGTTAVAFAVTVAEGGTIIGQSGTTDDEAFSLKGPAYLSGDKNAGFLCRWQISSAANFQFEMGLVDPLTDDTLPAVSDVDTPAIANGAVTVAVLHMDTDQTLTSAAGVFDGDATYATSSVTTWYTPGSATPAVWTPTAATWYTTIVQTTTDYARIGILDANGTLIRVLNSDGKRFEGGTLVQPWVFGRSRVNTNKTMTIDKIAWWQDR